MQFLKNIYRILLIFTLMLGAKGLFGTGTAIIGGYDDDGNPYTALISPQGTPNPITLGATGGEIFSVAMNDVGNAVVGGVSDGDPYVALASPDGTATELTLGVVNGAIRGVAINTSSYAIVGGIKDNNQPYAAFLSPGGAIDGINLGTLSPTTDFLIFSVDINDTGNAIVGGTQEGLLNQLYRYASLVAADGATASISFGGGSYGYITSVAINNSGYSIIGGDDGSGGPYAALVSPGATLTEIGISEITNGYITSVGINDSGTAIIGGYESGEGDIAYAAMIFPGSTMTDEINLGITNGYINSVAINEAGTAIIGGYNPGNYEGYIALVEPGTTGANQVLMSSTYINIQSVAINDIGCAIAGGKDYGIGTAYIALISPDGTLTEISLPQEMQNTSKAFLGTGEYIHSVAINNSSGILAATVPTSIGAGNNFANGILSLCSKVLPNHNRRKIFLPRFLKKTDEDISLVADASDRVLSTGNSKTCCPTYAVWGAGFGDYNSLKDQQSFPDTTNWIGGGMLGFDYRYCKNMVLGFGGAYAYSDVDFSDNAGKASSNQGFLSLYGTWYSRHLYVNGALWGGIYRGKNERNTLGIITSTADIDGWILSPHLEASLPYYWNRCCVTVDPFVMFDWANNWQDGFTEKGEAGFNLIVGDLYASILRSEIGIRFIESFKFRCGCVTFEQKGSYVNLKPFGDSTTNTFFVGSVSSFTIGTFGDQVQNLGVVAVSGQFNPDNCRYPYVAINYQGEFGSSSQNQFFSLEVGKTF